MTFFSDPYFSFWNFHFFITLVHIIINFTFSFSAAVMFSIALYKYFTLPDKKGQRSKVVPLSYSTLQLQKKEVSQLVKKYSVLGEKIRGPYLKISGTVVSKSLESPWRNHELLQQFHALQHTCQYQPSSQPNWKIKYLCECRKRKRDGKHLVLKYCLLQR